MNKKFISIGLALVLLAGAVGGADLAFVIPASNGGGSAGTASTGTAGSSGGGAAAATFDCGTLFTTGAASAQDQPLVSPALTTAGTFSGMLGIGVLLVLIMLALLGVVYAIGTAFNINKLNDFVRREYVETLANIIIIVVVLVGGFAIFNNATIFFADLAAGSIGTQALQTTGSSPTAATSQVFTAICNNYENTIINNNLYNYINVVSFLFIINTLVTLKINLDPNEFGFTLNPLTGVQTLQTTVWSEEAISFGIISMGGMLIMLLFVIYFLFPIFFFAGVVFRCLPWTRAAGGSMLALFISFYIIFPALLYTFSQFSAGNGNICGKGTLQATQELCSSGGIGSQVLSSLSANFQGVLAAALAIFGINAPGCTVYGFGCALYANTVDFTNTVAYSILQMIGLIISFIIAYDLMEFLGDILGSPSLQSGRILSRVV